MDKNPLPYYVHIILCSNCVNLLNEFQKQSRSVKFFLHRYALILRRGTRLSVVHHDILCALLVLETDFETKILYNIYNNFYKIILELKKNLWLILSHREDCLFLVASTNKQRKIYFLFHNGK